MCKTGQPHRWQARSSIGQKAKAAPKRLAEQCAPAMIWLTTTQRWQQSGTGRPTGRGSNSKAAWRCGLCGHRWSAKSVNDRTQGTGCPQCAQEARRIQSRQPSISAGAPHLLAEWDWGANVTHGWHPDRITLGSAQKMHWVIHDECKLGLVHRWQAKPPHRIFFNTGSPFPSGRAVCACNSLVVQCPEAAMLWDHQANGATTPDGITVQSHQVVCWRAADGSSNGQHCQKA